MIHFYITCHLFSGLENPHCLFTICSTRERLTGIHKCFDFFYFLLDVGAGDSGLSYLVVVVHSCDLISERDFNFEGIACNVNGAGMVGRNLHIRTHRMKVFLKYRRSGNTRPCAVIFKPNFSSYLYKSWDFNSK